MFKNSSSDDLLFADIQDAIQDRPLQHSPGYVDEDRVLQLPGYEILREVHRGGQGIVYEATQKNPNRRVAVKVLLHGEFSSPRQRFRFEREVALIAALNHPRIVTIYDSGFCNGQPYYVMEFIEGIALNRDVRGRRPADMSLQECRKRIVYSLELLLQLCDAVTCLQQHGLIHRDLKPENILLDRQGRLHVVDFGLARRVDEDDALHPQLQTKSGEFLGTLAYASPEQLSAGATPVDARSDVFSLGVILFELLTGDFPHGSDASVVAIVDRVCNQDPYPPSSLNTAVDRDVDTIVLKCLKRDVDRRYQSAEQVAGDIRRYLAGEPIESRRDSRLYVLQKTVRRHWPAFLTGLAFLIVLVASSIVSLSLWQRAETRLQRAIEAETEAVAAKNEEVFQRKESEFRGYVSSLSASDGALRNYHVSDAYDHLFGAPEELRDFEWDYALSRIDTSVDTWNVGDALQLLEVSSDRKSFAVGGLDGTVTIVDSESGSPLFVVRDCGRVTAMALHPTKELLVVGLEDGRLRERDLNSEIWTRELRPQPAMVNALAFSPDGQRLIAGAGRYPAPGSDFNIRNFDSDTDIYATEARVYAIDLSPDGTRVVTAGDMLTVRDSATGEEFASVDLNGHWCRNVCFSADGEFIFADEPDRSLVMRSVETLEKKKVLPCPDASVTGLAAHPDTTSLAATFTDGTVRLWDTALAEPTGVFWGHLGWAHDVAYSDDGSRVFSVGQHGNIKVWNPAAEASDFHRVADSSAVLGLTHTSDGSTIVTCSFSARIRLWDVASGTELKTLNGHSASVNGIDLSPDDQVLVSASADKTVRIWNLKSGKSRKLRGHNGEVLCVSFDPTGQVVASGGIDGTIRIWNAETREEQTVLDSESANAIRWLHFLPENQGLVAVSEQNVEVWSVAERRLIRTWVRPRNTWYAAAALHPDGRHLATGGDAGEIQLWDLEAGEQVSTFRWHEMALTALAFNPSGTRLVSASMGGAVKVWHVERQVEVMSLPSKRQIIRGLEFSPDGKRIAAAQFDGTMVWWEAVPPTVRLGSRFQSD